MCMPSRLFFSASIVSDTFEHILLKAFSMNCVEPMGNPRIVRPSVVSFPFVYFSRHSFSVVFDCGGK